MPTSRESLSLYGRGDCVPFEEGACELVVRGEVNPCGVAVAKASPNRAIQSRVLDPKPSDLPMARLKRG